MRFLLEIGRIILLIFILGGLLWTLLNGAYNILGFNLENNQYAWFLWIAILIFIFISYRNHLQFSGWNPKQKKEKLSKNLVLILLTSALILLIIIPFIG